MTAQPWRCARLLRIVAASVQLAEPRAGHAALTTSRGDILFAGGVGVGDGSSFSLTSIERLEYRPAD